MRYKNRKIVKSYPAPTDDRLAELLGFMLGDGNLRRDALVVWVKDYERPFIEPLMGMLGTVKCYLQPKQLNHTIDVFGLMVHNKALVEEYRKHFYPKRVPDWMLAKPLDYRIRAVRGLMEAEGSVGWRGCCLDVRFVNTNASIVNLVRGVYKELGILYGLSVCRREGRKDVTCVRVCKSGISNFVRKIGFLSSKKNERVSKI